MGRAPCCDKSKVKRGPWSPDEDATLKNYLENYGTGGNWIALPHKAGLKRCGKSCRLRWLNYLRPNINHGAFTEEEDNIICTLYSQLGSRWSVIASKLQGRTDNDVKNHWNTKLKKKLVASKGNRTNDPSPSQPQSPIIEAYNPHFSAMLSQISPAMPPPPPPTVGIYAQEGSSNISMDNNYGSPLFGNGGGLQDAFSMDFGSELISFDQMSGIWSQGTILEGANPNNGYANLVNPLYADIRPGVVCQNVTANQYY